MCVCVCVCVCKREREREQGVIIAGSSPPLLITSSFVQNSQKLTTILEWNEVCVWFENGTCSDHLKCGLMNIHEGRYEGVVREPAVGVVTPPTALTKSSNTTLNHCSLHIIV